MKQTYGAAVKKFYPGMYRECKNGHDGYQVTEAMSNSGSYRCPKCASKYAVEYARKNREKKRQWNNKYSSSKSAERAKKTAAYRAKYPERYAAHNAVHTAIRNGTLVKQPCEICGSINAHAHHDDYKNHLDVKWYCHAHHMERHYMLAERNKP